MIKKTITLETLLNLMEYLEKEISLTQSFVLVSNAALKSKSDDKVGEKVKQQYDKRQKCLKQLQVFKSAKTIANSEEIETVSNNARIYELSDLKRDQRFHSTLIGQKSKPRKGSKAGEYTFFIPKSELEDELQRIEERMSELKNQMSDFNESFEVEVDVDEDLDLI